MTQQVQDRLRYDEPSPQENGTIVQRTGSIAAERQPASEPPSAESHPAPPSDVRGNTIVAQYSLVASAAEAPGVALDVALEQSVEVPLSLVDKEPFRDQVLGAVRNLEAALHGKNEAGTENGRANQIEAEYVYRATVEYPADLGAGNLHQLVNLLYGNVSMKRQVRLDHFELPPEVLSQYAGPRFGISGLRQMLGVWDRPLLATALKPKGASNTRFAEMVRQFTAGGGDIVKDDHNLADRNLSEFQARVQLCHAATIEGSAQSGGRSLYFPVVNGSVSQIRRQMDYAAGIGVRGVLICPWLVGLENVRELASDYPLVMMAHPTATGTFFHDRHHGISPGALLGLLWRLAGCDITIFPSAGGRFTFTETTCGEIAEQCRGSWGSISPSWPAPAGGMRFETIPAMAKAYGVDSIFLIGGALLSDSASLEASTKRFANEIRRCFPQKSCSPSEEETAAMVAGSFVSACELPVSNSRRAELRSYIPFSSFEWNGRSPVAYKESAEIPFQHVKRVELIGQAGEKTAFDVRYFEIGANGYSSYEVHQHTHVIIGVRGTGLVEQSGEVLPCQPNDVFYIAPGVPHQLRNPSAEPFGFYCVVDHVRDRPKAVTAQNGA